ncbi:Major Facilitator Superfamily protein [Quadrisphaera granulorum]|uniref:MFS transporter n=1 Tax=Quadrisphaera granulorum TaxID=317664 RepID=A0A316A5P6_9ACTN|nr:MFS transporter [Quadrisphaera granulorum]PWJ52893.1 MFS transporter [Quadrisphaera granulorum]SZE97275.1 Major Facilitator Superfamily protein [Quadrisphaera granulorum]
MSTPGAAARRSLVAVVGVLVLVELVSGVLQAFYTPLLTDVAARLRIPVGDVNWFEAAQLAFSALAVPVLARLADLWGPRAVLLLSASVTAAGSWLLVLAPGFWTFMIGWVLQGAYVVWLPLEVALVHRRTAGSAQQGPLVRRSAGVLVAGLQLGAILGALSAGAVATALPLQAVLALPALAVTACVVVVWVGVERTPGTGWRTGGGLDGRGLALLAVVLGLVMGALVAVRLLGVASPLPWGLLAASIAAGRWMVRVEARTASPLVDVRLLAARGQWPVQATAFLFGASVLGAQVPLATFARTDPAVAGYGLGADAAGVSVLIGAYLLAMVTGALVLRKLPAAAVLVTVGYAMLFALHGSTASLLACLVLVGFGNGALVAGLPAAAAAAAPPDRVAFATGMTNTTKTVGGAVASAVFAVALASTGSLGDPAAGAAPLVGYYVVWGVCAVTSLVSVGFLVSNARSARGGRVAV